MKKILTGALATFCVGVAVAATATDAVTANASQLVYWMEMVDTPPACVLTLEEGKVKNMAEWGYCRVDEEYDAWYFRGDGTGTVEKNPEIRFVAEGVQTTTKPYSLIPMEVGSFSFDYALVNDNPKGVDDISSEHYIVQILGADTRYPVMLFDIEADGDWHTITVDESTPFYGATGGDAVCYGEYKHNFCGFLFKMGCLDGEYLIKNIRLYDFDGNEILVESEEESGGGEDNSSSMEEDSGSVEESVEIEDSYDEDKDNIGTFDSSTGSATTSTSGSKSKGCGSFGVGAMTLGTLAAAGVVLGVSKKKRK